MDSQASEIPYLRSREKRRTRGSKARPTKSEEDESNHPGSPKSKKIKIEIDSDGEGGVGREDGEEEEEKEEEEEELDLTPAVNGGGSLEEDSMIDIDESAYLSVKKELISDDILEPQVNIKVEEPDFELNGDDDGKQTNGNDFDGDDGTSNTQQPNRVYLTVKKEFATINEENGLQPVVAFGRGVVGEGPWSAGQIRLAAAAAMNGSVGGCGGGRGGWTQIRFTSSEDDQLIGEVRKHRELYDSAHLNYTNTARRAACWELIAAQMNCNPEDCKRRWAQLRQNYRKSRSRTGKVGAGGGGGGGGGGAVGQTAIKTKPSRLEELLAFIDDSPSSRLIHQAVVATTAGDSGGNHQEDQLATAYNTENSCSLSPPPVAATCGAPTSTENLGNSPAEIVSSCQVAAVARPGGVKLPDSETIAFLDLYARERLLYDTSMEQYKDRDLRAAAVKRISDALNVAGFGPRDVIAKFKNMRNTYCQELKKIAESEQRVAEGRGRDVYVPKLFWFEKINSFVRPFIHHRGGSGGAAANKSSLKSPSADDTASAINNNNNNNMTIITDHHMHPSGVVVEQNMMYLGTPPDTPSPTRNYQRPPPPYPLNNHALLLQLQAAPLVGGGASDATKLIGIILPSAAATTAAAAADSGSSKVAVPAIAVAEDDEALDLDMDMSYQSSTSSLSPLPLDAADPLAISAEDAAAAKEHEYYSDSCSSSLMQQEPTLVQAFSDRELVELPTRELNRRLRGLPAQLVRRLKMKRRTLKNRSYANNSRTKRSNRSNELEQQNRQLMDKLAKYESQLGQVRAERDFYRRQCHILRGAVSPEKLAAFGGDRDPPQSLAQLLSQSPPPLRLLSPPSQPQPVPSSMSLESLLAASPESPPEKSKSLEPSKLTEPLPDSKQSPKQLATQSPEQEPAQEQLPTSSTESLLATSKTSEQLLKRSSESLPPAPSQQSPAPEESRSPPPASSP